MVHNPLFVLDVMPNEFHFIGILHLSIFGSILLSSVIVREGLGFETLFQLSFLS
jgi:hypothetical protein